MKTLTYLGECYFHQDWDIEAPTGLGVVTAFRAGETAMTVRKLRADLEKLLATDPSESALREVWQRRCRADYLPSSEGRTYRAWFAAMLDLLRVADEREGSAPDDGGRQLLLDAIEGGESWDLVEAMITASAGVDDGPWLHDRFVELLGHRNGQVRATAVTCLAQVAQVRGHVDLDAAPVRRRRVPAPARPSDR